MNTKKLILYSLDPQIYSNKEIDCMIIKDIRQFASDIAKKGIKRAQKIAKVKVREGVVGEEVDTRPRVRYNNKIYVINETKGKVEQKGSMIVKNPDGEEYIVKPEQFAKKYKQNKEGVFEPISFPIKYVVCNDNVCFEAPWGGDMFGIKGCILNISNLDEVYAIQNESFEKTYQKLSD